MCSRTPQRWYSKKKKLKLTLHYGTGLIDQTQSEIPLAYLVGKNLELTINGKKKEKKEKEKKTTLQLLISVVLARAVLVRAIPPRAVGQTRVPVV